MIEDLEIIENKTTNEFYLAVDPITSTCKTFSDQTGRFPIAPGKVNRYIMLLHNYDSNTILGEPMKSIEEADIVRIFTKTYNVLKTMDSNQRYTAWTMSAQLISRNI